MKIWLDAQLSPIVARWLCDEFKFDVQSLRAKGLAQASDHRIFAEAKKDGIDVIISKDADIVQIVESSTPPPRLVWLTCGNRSSAQVMTILRKHLPRALDMLSAGATVVEISDT
ncbi:MAG: DUF5615 family PIN-like protein [Phycisphaerales bacterium]